MSDEQRHAITGFLFGLIGFLLMGVFESVLMVGLRPSFFFWLVSGLALRYGFEVAAPREVRTLV